MTVVRLRRQSTSTAKPERSLHRGPEKELRPQQLRPHHRPPQGRRQPQKVPHHRLQARQDRHGGRTVLRLEYDPNRSANIALVQYAGWREALHPGTCGPERGRQGRLQRRMPTSSRATPCRLTTSRSVPLSTTSSCTRARAAQLVRAAGVAAQLMAKEGGMAQHPYCPPARCAWSASTARPPSARSATSTTANVTIGKAGRKRHMGIRPTVRGSVMNPCDHPHGGGEGKSPIGRPGPVTPWGKPALGYKTRKTKNRTNKFIVKRRNAK